jgi:hypothetical protein
VLLSLHQNYAALLRALHTHTSPCLPLYNAPTQTTTINLMTIL